MSDLDRTPDALFDVTSRAWADADEVARESLRDWTRRQGLNPDAVHRLDPYDVEVTEPPPVLFG